MRTFPHALLTASLALLGALGFSSNASAQITLAIDSVVGDGGDRTVSTDLFNPQSDDCANPGNTTITLLATGTTMSSVYLWYGASGASCELQTSRTGDMQVCDNVGNLPLSGSGPRAIEFTLADIVNAASNVSDPCTNTAIAGTTITLYAFFTDSDPASSGDIDGANFATIGLTIDVTGPTSPDLEPDSSDALVFRTGDNTVTINWTANGDEAQETYRALYDNTVDMNCENSTAGGDLPFVESGADATSLTLTLDNLGLTSPDDTALVTLVPVDRIGNVGTESSRAVCVTKVDALDFCEYYESSGEGSCPESCAADRRAPTSSLLLVALGLFVLGRRRLRLRSEGALV